YVARGFGIEEHLGALQPGNQLAGAQAAHAAGRVNTDDPQPAELALADLAVAKGVNPAADQGDQGLTVKVVPAHDKALGEPAETFAAPEDSLAAACAYHRENSCPGEPTRR